MNIKILCGALLIWLMLSIFNQPVLSQKVVFKNKSTVKNTSKNIVKSKYCSPENVDNLPKLIDELMIALPDYVNRVTQRSRRLKREVDIFSYVLVAGKPDLSPLPLNPGISNTPEYDSTEVKQVFFTTLERKYINQTSIELQQFHRLFLTKTDTGWELVMMFSQTGAYPKTEPLAPLRDSSHSAIAQGVKLWLRDCHSKSN
ncbi:hypothetical protein H6F32_14550 [Anabaena sp. FACHB-1237]|uniref:hypothetical protein n=1 Tax=Anabaena sp. FACHB-1237 TaxID=2692769 RepID=UPI00167FEA7D|nr:hypothetical protein [Anabaena sp. FACHB-1237]MBD2138769.1 hypothetical protein [Anabaena sp. FACHB-1237]